ncbi:diaminopimelate epimerase [Robertkochia marina]|uniref:Diaminopimelate epimerase n=1 Tax=Robertkochia marina TaxID=1227945 RepID=A0A4S3M0V8_9FLAO|nr:diaminopimelate epimerase [Robertkochia marina]THD68070.1 diaminopimelate epimerase [Robertkochia marina]TRZ42645.1 diaminopimelate epimerase [Robertkochia marina]
MKLQFYKYQGTGNDFIMIDNRDMLFSKNDTKLVQRLCDRKFGIGADGLILLENDDDTDFKMVYYNADGNQSTMCGNGGRCLVAFAKEIGVISDRAEFMAVDGLHRAEFQNDEVVLEMQPVDLVENFEGYSYLDTGSPHHVQLIDNLESLDVKQEGSRLRYGKYGKAGSNINFVKKLKDDLFAVRTYERGVEDETLSCGTGVTAVALAMYDRGYTKNSAVGLETPGGRLEVLFEANDKGYKNIKLKGKAEKVFEGILEL